MAQRDLIVSFLSGVTDEVRDLYKSEVLYLQSPVAQSPAGGYPGGRAGYQQWLAQYRGADGRVIPGMFRAAGGLAGDTIGRVCVMGFSNGCIGVDEVLRAPDSQRIDTVLAIDGIHGGYVLKDGKKVLYPPAYKNFLNQAAYVVSFNPDVDPDAPVMVVTHSVIRPPGFPSTTETAELLWQMTWEKAPEDVLTPDCDECSPREHLEHLAGIVFPDGGVKIYSNPSKKNFTWTGVADGWYDRRAQNNFYVFGWADIRDGVTVTRDPTGNADHIFEGRVILREMLKEYTVRRWNDDCGQTAGYGLGHHGGIVDLRNPRARGRGAFFLKRRPRRRARNLALAALECKPGQGVVYDQGSGGKQDYYPNLPPDFPVQSCPAPSPGQVVVGSPNDPCKTSPAPGPPAPPPPGPSPGPTPGPGQGTSPKGYGPVAVGALGAGAVVGYYGMRHLIRRWL